MVTDSAVNEAVPAKLRRLREHRGYFTRDELGDPAPRFGPPSNYSLSAAELARHVRRLRRQGWQGWEVRARFDTGSVTGAA